MIVTIDGPTASGKSTTAKALAKRLGYYHLNSGLLYRALAYLLTQAAGYTEKELQQPHPTDITCFLDPDRFQVAFEPDEMHVLFEGTDITHFLKDKIFDTYSSILATNLDVREALRALQHALGKNVDLVVDGRDTGSVVFPDAQKKFYLTASPEVRAKRWQQMQQSLGNTVALDKAIETIKNRDKRDENRKIAPLIVPEDAITIDNSGLSIDQTIDRMLVHLKDLK